MKRALIIFALVFATLLIIPLSSAEIIIDTQPQSVYSLGDVITIPITLKSASDISGTFNMDLLCDGKQTNFYKNGISISSGEEKHLESSLVLTKDVIGNLKGVCKIKAYLGSDYLLTNEFKISDNIIINATFVNLEFNPEETMSITGKAFRENGKPANGIINLSIVSGNLSSLTQLGTVNNGDFSVKLTLPKDMKAGAYLIKLEAYEEDLNNNVTNSGFINQNIVIRQVPTSLEIVFENDEVEPGTNLQVKGILHDQTGEKIDSLVFLTIKNKNSKIMEQKEVATDEIVEYPVAYNEAPSAWKVVALSNKLTTESTFAILPKESVNIQVINQTVIITNTGNVPYNKTAVVKIGNESLNIDVYLDVDKSQKYILSAPDGKYDIEILLEGNNDTVSREVALTGKAIDVKKSNSATAGFVNNSLLWIFVIAILGFVAFIIFKKGYQKTFIGYISSKKHRPASTRSNTPIENSKGKLLDAKYKGELSLSIKGDKQDVSVAALKIKNFREIQKKQGNTEDTLKQISHLADQQKAIIYENQDTLFFILAPTLTRTFKNEKTTLELAMKIKEVLAHHNKMFKQRIEFGISLNYGPIVLKQNNGIFEFMSMGTLITASKKVASEANGEILLAEKIYDRMRSDIKATKHEKGNMNVFSVNEIRHTEDHNKFLKGFLSRMEKDKKKE